MSHIRKQIGHLLNEDGHRRRQVRHRRSRFRQPDKISGIYVNQLSIYYLKLRSKVCGCCIQTRKVRMYAIGLRIYTSKSGIGRAGLRIGTVQWLIITGYQPGEVAGLVNHSSMDLCFFNLFSTSSCNCSCILSSFSLCKWQNSSTVILPYGFIPVSSRT